MTSLQLRFATAWLSVAALVPGVQAVASPTKAAGASTTLIVNALLVDGTGAAPRKAAVRIGADRITAVGALEPLPGEAVIDAHGLALAPGFIDTHSHHAGGIFEHPDALAAVSQGITTIVVGQDGSLEQPPGSFLARLEREPVAVNVAAYLGHGTIRSAVMGSDFRRAATAREVTRMRGMVADGMRAGALGLSTGLEYDPGIYSTKAEVIALAAEAARFGGRYISHIRSEDRRLWEALEEIIEIGRVNHMPVQVSHMKLAMVDWWGQADRMIAMLDRARAEGIDITGDVYPYEYWHSTMTVLFPQRDFDNRASAEFALRSLVLPQDLIISRFSADPSVAGKTLQEISIARGSDPASTLMQLIAQSQAAGGDESVIAKSMDPGDVAKLIAWPHSNICTDGMLEGTHPRGAGAFTRVLRYYVRERGVLTLAEAIRKMTGESAAHVGLRDRGVVRAGAYADLVLFDPDRVADRATLENPRALSVGVEKVWVNGSIVYADGEATGRHSGRPLRRAP